jgi:hypothetical protein
VLHPNARTGVVRVHQQMPYLPHNCIRDTSGRHVRRP